MSDHLLIEISKTSLNPVLKNYRLSFNLEGRCPYCHRETSFELELTMLASTARDCEHCHTTFNYEACCNLVEHLKEITR